MGSFEDWDNIVRSALIWAGWPDPLEGRQRIRDDADEDLQIIRELHAAWFAAFGDPGGTVADAIQRAECDEELQAALAALSSARSGKGLNPRSIGNRLSALQKRIVDGRKLVKAAARSRAAVWRVVSAEK